MKKLFFILCFLMIIPTVSFARNYKNFSLNLPIVVDSYQRNYCEYGK